MILPDKPKSVKTQKTINKPFSHFSSLLSNILSGISLKYFFPVFFLSLFSLFLSCKERGEDLKARIHEDSLASDLLNTGILVLDSNGIDLYYSWNKSSGFQEEEKIPRSDNNLFSDSPISDFNILHFFYLYSNSSEDIEELIKSVETRNQSDGKERISHPEIFNEIDLLTQKKEKILRDEGLIRIRNINLLWDQYRDLQNYKALIKLSRKKKRARINKKAESILIQMSKYGYHPLISENLMAVPLLNEMVEIKSYELYDNGNIKTIKPVKPLNLPFGEDRFIRTEGYLSFYKTGELKSFYTKDTLIFEEPDKNKITVQGARIKLYKDGNLRQITNTKPFPLYLPGGYTAKANSAQFSIHGELLFASFLPENSPVIKLPDGTLCRSLENRYTRLGHLTMIKPASSVTVHLPDGQRVVSSQTKTEGTPIEFFPTGIIRKITLSAPVSIADSLFNQEISVKGELIFNKIGEIIAGEFAVPQTNNINNLTGVFDKKFNFYTTGSLHGAKLNSHNLNNLNPDNFLSFSEKNQPTQIILFPDGKLKSVIFDTQSSVYIKTGTGTVLKSVSYSPEGTTESIFLLSGTVKVDLPGKNGTITAGNKIDFYPDGTLKSTKTIHSFLYPLDIRTKILIPEQTLFAAYPDGAPHIFFINPTDNNPVNIKGFFLTLPGLVELYPNGSLMKYKPTGKIKAYLPNNLPVYTESEIEYHPNGKLKKITPINPVLIDHHNLPYRISGTIQFHSSGNPVRIDFSKPSIIRLGTDSNTLYQSDKPIFFTEEGILYRF